MNKNKDEYLHAKELDDSQFIEESSNFFAKNKPQEIEHGMAYDRNNYHEDALDFILKDFSPDQFFDDRPRNFFENTTHSNMRNNNDMLTSFPPKFSRSTTKEIMEHYKQNGNDNIALVKFGNAKDCAYTNMHLHHKNENPNDLSEDFELILKHKLEKEMFHYLEDKLTGQDYDISPVQKAHKEYSQFKQLEENQKLEQAEIMKNDERHLAALDRYEEKRLKRVAERKLNLPEGPSNADIIEQIQSDLDKGINTYATQSKFMDDLGKDKVLSRIDKMRGLYK